MSGTIFARYVRAFRTATTSSPDRTISVVPLDDGAPKAFAAQLADALDGKVALLDLATVTETLGTTRRPTNDALARYAETTEAGHDLLIYDTDQGTDRLPSKIIRKPDGKGRAFFFLLTDPINRSNIIAN